MDSVRGFELNAIITGNIVGGPHGHLHTFGCIQWECKLFNGRPKARCYPFAIEGHRFRNKNSKVRPISDPMLCLILLTSHPMSYTISCPIYIVLFCIQECVCLVALYPSRSGPLDEFNVNRDFDISGAGEVWYAGQLGCGATAVRFYGRSLSPMRWQCGRSKFRNPGNGRLRPWGVCERRP